MTKWSSEDARKSSPSSCRRVMPVVRAPSGRASLRCLEAAVERQVVVSVAVDRIVKADELDPFQGPGPRCRPRVRSSGQTGRSETSRVRRTRLDSATEPPTDLAAYVVELWIPTRGWCLCMAQGQLASVGAVAHPHFPGSEMSFTHRRTASRLRTRPPAVAQPHSVRGRFQAVVATPVGLVGWRVVRRGLRLGCSSRGFCGVGC